MILGTEITSITTLYPINGIISSAYVNIVTICRIANAVSLETSSFRAPLIITASLPQPTAQINTNPKPIKILLIVPSALRPIRIIANTEINIPSILCFWIFSFKKIADSNTPIIG